MKSITQKHPFSCGVACTAFVNKTTYESILKFFTNGLDNAKTVGFLCKDIIKALNKAGLNYQYKFINSPMKRKIYHNGTIVFIKRNKTYPVGHYLVRKNSYWMDPWINFSRNKDIKFAKSGFRKRLPGHPIYAILPN